jgi:hypothetical protein
MVLGFTVGIGLRDGTFDTVSAMVARADLTLHGFAMVTVAMVACQAYWVYTQLQRWGMLHRQAGGGWSKHIVASTCIALGSLGGIVGSLGFGIVSTNLEQEQHLRFAGIAFSGSLLYLIGFAYLSRKAETVHSSNLGIFWIVLGICCLVLLAYDGEFWWEYILVTALHVAALALTIPMEHRIFYTLF